jgi:hypothetical protein
MSYLVKYITRFTGNLTFLTIQLDSSKSDFHISNSRGAVCNSDRNNIHLRVPWQASGHKKKVSVLGGSVPVSSRFQFEQHGVFSLFANKHVGQSPRVYSNRQYLH